MGVMIDSQLPYLVGMDDDVLSTGIVIFHLKVTFGGCLPLFYNTLFFFF